MKLARQHRPWLIVAGLATITALVLGTTYASLGIFVEPIRMAFGWTSEQAARLIMAFVLSMNGMLPVVGKLIDRVGARAVMLVGIIATAAAYELASRAHSLPLLVVSFALAGVGVGACTYLPCTIVASQWFEERRGLALGIIFGTSSVGSAAFPVVLVTLLARHDWRAIVAGIGIAVFSIGVPIAIGIVKTGPLVARERVAGTAKSSVWSLLKLKPYWLITSVLILSQLSFSGIYFYLVPFFASVGFTSQVAAWFFGATGAASFLGAMVFGPLIDKFGAKRMMMVALLVMTASSLLLLLTGNRSPGIVAGVAFAVLWGSVVSTPYQFAPILLAEIAGLRNLGELLGFSNLLAGAASSLGPMMTGAIYDATRNYSHAFEVSAALAACSLLPSILLLVTKRERVRV